MSRNDVGDQFQHLDPVGRGVARLATQPAWPVLAALTVAVLLSWAILAGMAATAAARAPALAGPGAALLDRLSLSEFPAAARLFIELCLTPAYGAAAGFERFAALAAMWFVMAMAMMLPSAAPMVRTYCEIADTARGNGGSVVHPTLLVSGYLAVWLLASLVFAILTLALQSVAPAEAPLAGAAGAAALLVAGAWQFSSLKEACLKKCRAPFATLFSRWTTAPAGVFRLGAEQGAWCLGCCWALMLVMFAVGIMNVFWMALIGLFTVVEKREGGRAIGRLAGAILLVWSLALLVVSR